MGLRLNCQEVSDFVRVQNVTAEKKVVALEGLLRDFQRFVDTQGLKGVGWDSAKNLIRQVFVPLVKIQVRRAESLMRANSKVASLMEGDLAGDEQLDEDGLAHDVERLRGLQRQLLEYLPNEASMLWRQYGEQIQVLEEKIAQLRAFDVQIRGLYDEVEACAQQAGRALSALGSHGGGWDNKTGRFTTAGVNMDWAADIGEYWGKREQSYDKVAWYRASFGMDRVQAELLAEFDQKFEAYAEGQGWSAEKKQYEYLRLLASITYKGLMWEQAAGVHTADDRRKMFGALGIEDVDYTLFVFAVKKQSNGRDSTGLNKLVPHEVGFAHLIGALACMLKQDRDALNPGSIAYRKVTEGTQYLYHDDKIFHHKRTSYYREAATFAGDIASGSLPGKDIRADIDAINLSNILKDRKNAPITEVIGEYYRGVHDGGVNRMEDFLKHYGREYAGADSAAKGYRFLQDHLDEMASTVGMDFIGEKADADKQRKAREGFLRFLEENRGCAGDG